VSLEITPTVEQQTVIDYPSNLVAIAKPGSGKTFVIAAKIRAAVITCREHQGVIAISYTNKASDEIKRRAHQEAVEFKDSFFGTIDRFCDLEVILPFLPHLWGRPENDVTILRIRDLPTKEQEHFASIQPNQVSLKVLEEHLGLVRSYFTQGKLLLEMNGALALYTLRASVACRSYLRSRYTRIFVDEYQDSGLEQHELFLELQRLGLIAVAVGDADQSIFGFSGKDSKYLTALAALPEFKTFPITYNHRCHPSIINYSLRFLAKDSQLLPAETIHVYKTSVAGNQIDVATWLDQKLNTICAKFDVSKKSDVGVLVRTTNTGEIIDRALNLKHRFIRSHALEEHFSLWGKLFARLLAYHFDSQNTAQAIIDEFGPRMFTAQDVKRCRQLIKTLNRPELPDVADFVAVAVRLCPNAQSEGAIQVLSESLLDEHIGASFAQPADDEVQIMSIHKAKGLEFDVVFHLDLLEWVLPRKIPGEGNDFDHCLYPDLDEDVHLHYVGITRARKCCVLCTSTRRINAAGDEKNGSPSEFLNLSVLRELRRPIADLIEVN
jgi:hypothetical protein